MFKKIYNNKLMKKFQKLINRKILTKNKNINR